MTARFSIIIALFLMISSLTLNGQDVEKKEITKIQENARKEKISLLKKLSNAFKFTANSHAREKKRIIDIIDTLLKDSVLLTSKEFKDSQSALTNTLKVKLAFLHEAIKEIQTEIKNNKPPINPSSTEPEEKGPPKIADNKEEVLNNDKYIEGLIKAILTTEKAPDLVAIKQKQQRLALIKSLSLNKTSFKDTIEIKGGVERITERERLVRLKHAAEVWGFLPYDRIETDLKYKLFSTIIINAYALNGSNGRSMNDLDLNNFEVSRRAKVIGTKLFMGITSGAASTSTFLQNSPAQDQFISQIISFLAENKMEGLNIQFSGVDSNLSSRLLRFISTLSRECKKGQIKFQLSLTVPAFDIDHGYDLAALSPFTDKFLIDFSQKVPGPAGPVAPLKQQSDYSIETCVSRYRSTFNLAPSKFIILLPFYGIKWDIDSKGKGTNPVSLSYSQIRSRYQFIPVTYDEQTASAIIETTDTAGVVNSKIWFDNEYTLGKKFDFALKDSLAGVAIWDMTADLGYGEIADELTYKFLVPDTLTVNQTDLTYQLQKFGWAYIIRNLESYYFVLGNPCHVAHDKVDRTLLSYINLILIAICLGLGMFCYSKIRTEGQEWEYKKPMLILTGIMTFILLTCGFAWIYLDADIPWFGVDKECIDMPFLVLYLIIIAGIGIGILLMRFLLFPIVREEDTP